MLRANLHNFIFVLAFVMIGALVFGLLNRTALAKLPVIGQVISLGARAA